MAFFQAHCVFKENVVNVLRHFFYDVTRFCTVDSEKGGRLPLKENKQLYCISRYILLISANVKSKGAVQSRNFPPNEVPGQHS